MAENSIRVLVADDHAAVRRGLCALLETEPEIHVVGAARNGSEAIHLAARTAPDVILMDLAMPGLGGLEAAQRIAAAQPHVRVLVLIAFSPDGATHLAVEPPIAGCLLKDTPPEELVRAVRATVQDEPVRPQGAARRHPAPRPAISTVGSLHTAQSPPLT
jgi:DNA-binding NarL/FixJ family response regulator